MYRAGKPIAENSDTVAAPALETAKSLAAIANSI
jgi:hypothetical protein